MIELALAFLGGLAGVGHCLGMCGPLALLVTARTQGHAGRLLGRQFVYALGRVSTYVTLGAFAGYLGWKLLRTAPTALHVQAILAVVAGVALLVQGVLASGLWRPRWLQGVGSCGPLSAWRTLLQEGRLGPLYLAGSLNGLIPCGLVYAFLALAGSTGSLFRGALVMLAFGLGTVPALAAAGVGGSLLRPNVRLRLVQVAACCVLLTGGWAVARGATQLWNHQTAPRCPLCAGALDAQPGGGQQPAEQVAQDDE